MTNPIDPVVSVDQAPELEHLKGEHWGATYKILTPSTRPDDNDS